MNPVLLVMTSALADATPENAAISAPATAESASPFSLLQTELNEMAGANIRQRQASTAERQHENTDPATMQALMAMLLAQPAPLAQPGLQKLPDGERVKMLAVAQPGAPLLHQLASVMKQEDAPGVTSSLSPNLQKLLTTLMQNLSQDIPQATPEQQAKLAIFNAQDLRAVTPDRVPLTPSQQASVPVESAEHGTAPRLLSVKKDVGTVLNQPVVTPSLFMVTSKDNPSTTAIGDRSDAITHAAIPAEMSTDDFGEKLTSLLKDRIQFQLSQQQQISTIRLDPPSLGRLDIAVQLDGGKLMVHIDASQSDVCRSLQQFSENLRQHLTAQNFMEVNVQVSSEGQSQQQRQQSGQQQDEVRSALALNDEPQYQQKESVLIKV
ncbi:MULTISPECIES: flagellar hook-length control protein FliK [Enterobacterales]|uniref:flagellar hook-length control protein FliK n=1 Tax=Enterobacterales TaxID=91347 RepID=UPI002ED96E09